MIKSKVYIYPTDTVWGIGANIYSEEAQELIANIKRTAFDKPVSIMFASINEVVNSFNLPSWMNEKWLTDFFALETTLLINKSRAQIEIPGWITKDSPLIAFRCVELNSIKDIINEVQAPITSTSLNHAGRAPVTSYEAAKRFFTKHCNNCELKNDHKNDLSGHASTIVELRDENQFNILREGALSEQVKSYLGL